MNITANTDQNTTKVTITNKYGDETNARLDETGTVTLIEDLVKTLPADSTVRELFTNRFGL